MAENQKPAIRYKVLDECFSNAEKDFFMKDLIEAVGDALNESGREAVDKRTIQRDIADMKRLYGIELREDLKGGKTGREKIYRYEDTNFSIYKKEITPTEAKQLMETISMLRRFKGLPNYKELELVLVWLKVNFGLEGMSEGTVMFAQNPYLKGLELYGDLLKAMMGKKKIAIMYAPYGRKKKIRQVHPYQLRQWNYRWYLIGYEERLRPRIQYVVIPLDRIERIVKVYSEGFVPQKDDDFDFDEYFKNIVGVSLMAKDEGKEEPKPVPVVAKVYYPNAWYIDTKPIHASQRVIEATEPWIKGEEGEKPKHGYMVFQWDVIPNEELVQALMVYADQMEVREPEWVKLKLIDRAKSILINNGIR
jgi:predicted DNA-binding transcriptional regulator YafY